MVRPSRRIDIGKHDDLCQISPQSLASFPHKMLHCKSAAWPAGSLEASGGRMDGKNLMPAHNRVVAPHSRRTTSGTTPVSTRTSFSNRMGDRCWRISTEMAISSSLTGRLASGCASHSSASGSPGGASPRIPDGLPSGGSRRGKVSPSVPDRQAPRNGRMPRTAARRACSIRR